MKCYWQQALPSNKSNYQIYPGII